MAHDISHLHTRIKKLSRKTVILSALAVLAAMVLAYSIGRTITPPWQMGLSWESPSIIASDGGASVVVDQNGGRVSFLNPNNEVVRTTNFDATSAYLDSIFCAYVDGGDVYLSGCEYYNDGSIISSERVLRYSSSGVFQEVVYEKQVPETDRQVVARIKDMEVVDGHLVLCVGSSAEVRALQVDEYGHTITLQQLDTQGPPFAADYNPALNALAATDYSGQVYVTNATAQQTAALQGSRINQGLTSNILLDDNATLYTIDRLNGCILSITAQGGVSEVAKGSGVTSICLQQNQLAYTNVEQGTIVVLGTDGEEDHVVQGAAYSLPLAARMLTFWLAVAYLVVLAAYALLKIGTLSTLRNNAIVAGLFLAVLLTCGYYTYSMYGKTTQTLDERLLTLAGFVSDSSAQTIGDDVAQIQGRDVFSVQDYVQRRENIDNIEDHLNKMVRSAGENGLDAYYEVYVLSQDQSSLYNVTVTDGTVPAGAPVEFAEVDDYQSILRNECGMFETSDEVGRYRCTLKPIYDSQGEVVGVLELGVNTQTLQAGLISEVMYLSLRVMLLLIILYLVISETRTWYEAVVQSRKRVAEGKHALSAALLTRPFAFLTSAIQSLDTTLMVLIALDMLSTGAFAGSAQINIYAGLPLILWGLGTTLGCILYGFLMHWVSARNLCIACASVQAVLFAGTAFMVGSGNLVGYCAMKMLSGLVSGGVLRNMVSALPGRSHNDGVYWQQVKAEAWAAVAGSILSVTIAGLVADAFGYAVPYAVAVPMAIALVVMGITLLPKGMYYTHSGKREKFLTGQGKGLARMFLSPAMLAYFFLVGMPLVIMEGYNSYLFPLYSEAYGFTSSDIAILYSAARVIAYTAGSISDKLIERGEDHWHIVLACLLLGGFALVGFIMNDSVVWALVVLLALAFVSKIVDPSRVMLWSRTARAHGFAEDQAQPVVQTMAGVIAAFEPVLLGVFLLSGNAWACIFAGAFMLVCGAAFYFTTRNTPMADVNQLIFPE
ncbi:MAG: MFS transporter [Coriobacteriia bacterium]|nr:MFS transporter [Coriobacteriia bacterium]